ncbi:MAG: exonuclease SbcCD subunit D [Ruminococcus sp.]|nr:exonuclease SbcCD subunit D [Ruminococcus sp.]
MKIIHLSDLHLGKRVNEFSMLEEQEYILKEIIGVIRSEAPDCVVIAGDVYDKSVPPAEAVTLFDDFLCSLSELDIHVFIISGNHDSPERIAFGSRLMDGSGIHFSPVYSGETEPFILSDGFGEVEIYMLPFIRPISVRRFFESAEISSYTDAVNAAIDAMNIDFDSPSRKILITHQFVTGASCCDSEDISVGGSDNVDSSAFDGFDYVALGHLHGPQNIGDERLRYCGTPLKYSFSEVNHVKSVTVVEMAEKGSISVRTVPLVPLHDMRELKGEFDEITGLGRSDDYLHITLTDENEIPEAMGRLRLLYPNIMKLDYDNSRTRCISETELIADTRKKTPLEQFTDFYRQRNGSPMSEEQLEFTKELIGEIWEEEI